MGFVTEVGYRNRSNRRPPSISSILWIALVSDGCATPQRFAARVKFCSSQSTKKYSICWILMMLAPGVATQARATMLMVRHRPSANQWVGFGSGLKAAGARWFVASGFSRTPEQRKRIRFGRRVCRSTKSSGRMVWPGVKPRTDGTPKLSPTLFPWPGCCRRNSYNARILMRLSRCVARSLVSCATNLRGLTLRRLSEDA